MKNCTKFITQHQASSGRLMDVVAIFIIIIIHEKFVHLPFKFSQSDTEIF